MPSVATGYRLGPAGYYSDADGSGPYSISSAGIVSLRSSAGVLTAGTNRSGTIATGATAQVLAAANTSRISLKGQNISAGDLWINEIGGTAAVDTAGSYKITAGSSFSIATNRAISIIGATTGQAFTATEV